MVGRGEKSLLGGPGSELGLGKEKQKNSTKATNGMS